MSEPNIIPIVDTRSALPVPTGLVDDWAGAVAPRDALARALTDLRISVTDRCNFRCSYCMPKAVFDKHHRFLPHRDLLTFEEITRVARVFVGLGVRKIRLTGGEPLLRKDLERLVEMLARLEGPGGAPLDLTLTTNGSLLARKAASLASAGLRRVTVSLDAMDDAVFRRMNDVDFPVADVLAGIEAAQAAGLGPVKVNMVVKRGTNDHEILPMARHFRGTDITLRYIEYMDVGSTNGWRMDEVVPSTEVRQRIEAHHPLRPVERTDASETASRWRYADGAGEVGFISSVTEAFCGHCTRARLSTEGQLYLCLFGRAGHDLRSLLRSATPTRDTQIAAAIARIWQGRDDQYSALRGRGAATASATDAGRVEMSYIGG